MKPAVIVLSILAIVHAASGGAVKPAMSSSTVDVKGIYILVIKSGSLWTPCICTFFSVYSRV